MDEPPAVAAPVPERRVFGRGETVVRLAGQRACQRRLDLRRDLVPLRAQRRQGVHQFLRGDRHRRVAGVRRRPSEHLEEHAAHRVEVAAPVHRVAHRLLGAHVGRRPDDDPGLGQAPAVSGAQPQRDAEIRHQGRILVQHDVLGLDVPVDEAAPVGVVERPDDLSRDLQRLRHGQPVLRVEPAAERGPLHVRHHVVDEAVRLAGVVEGEDVRMRQRRGDLDLDEEPLRPDARRQVGPQHLHRDEPVVPQVLRQIDGGHPSRAELSLDAVAVGQCGAQAIGGIGQAARLGCLSPAVG